MTQLARVVALVFLVAGGAAAQSKSESDERGLAAVDRLGAFDFQERTEAAQAVRRTDPAVIVPALLAAVRGHADEYVRYRALVVLAGFAEAMAGAPIVIRTVVFQWFESHPAPSALPALLAALETERSEFVRPALTRAIAAHRGDPRVTDVLVPLVLRGDDFFRSAVISALGDYRVPEALAVLTEVALRDGPLQDDAITALGGLGNESAKATLAKLQQSVSPALQPTVSAALCLAGIDCDQRVDYITETLRFAADHAGYQPLLRGAVHAANVLAIAGREPLLRALIDAGLGSSDPARAAIALGVGYVAVRRPLLLVRVIEAHAEPRQAMLLLREGFDMLAEDFDEEQFYVQMRRALWQAPDESLRRRTASALIETLEF
jgi:HEAT repeat protein